MSAQDSRATQFCRICHNACAILVDVDGGRAMRVRGDRESPLHRGYLCPKGASLPALHNDPERLLRPLKRNRDGGFDPIPLEDALDEIAMRLARTLAEDGPRSVMGYAATGIQPQVVLFTMLGAFLQAIESPWPPFSANSIDQAGKETAQALHGTWQAPAQGFHEADVALLVGLNPLVSHLGLPIGSPMRWLRDRQSAGMKLIVIDPRKSETARHADIHLQPRPGQDAAILAGLLHVILGEDLHDEAFVRQHTTGVESLKRAVAAYDPDFVASRADLDAADLVEAARAFARAERGFACAGTGANMTGYATLVEYLVLCLNTVCGRWLRRGEVVRSAPALRRPFSYHEQATSPAPDPTRRETPPLRVPGRTRGPGAFQIMDMVDEMLLPGTERIRTLFVAGGNPAAAWPDQRRTIRALQSLDLLVVLDPAMTATARLADYVIPPKLLLEVPAATTMQDSFGMDNLAVGYAESFAQYAPPAVEPPPGSELIEEWAFFYEVARRLERPLRVGRTEIPLDRRPTTDELLDRLTRKARIPLDEVKSMPHGAFFVDETIRVEPGNPEEAGRLELASPSMMTDLSVLAELDGESETEERFPFRLLARRMRHVQNSMLHGTVPGQPADNPAYLHPADIARLGIEPGDRILVSSAVGSIEASVAPDAGLRPGLVSISHGFGGLPDEAPDDRKPGANTGLLIDIDRDYDPYTGEPRMSDIPVDIRPRPDASKPLSDS